MLNGNHESLNVCGDFRYATGLCAFHLWIRCWHVIFLKPVGFRGLLVVPPATRGLFMGGAASDYFKSKFCDIVDQTTNIARTKGFCAISKSDSKQDLRLVP